MDGSRSHSFSTLFGEGIESDCNLTRAHWQQVVRSKTIPITIQTPEVGQYTPRI
jgi:hypothetical protein